MSSRFHHLRILIKLNGYMKKGAKWLDQNAKWTFPPETARAVTAGPVTEIAVTARPVTEIAVTGRVMRARLVTEIVVTGRVVRARPVTEIAVTGRGVRAAATKSSIIANSTMRILARQRRKPRQHSRNTPAWTPGKQKSRN